MISISTILLNACSGHTILPIPSAPPRIELPPDPVPATSYITDKSTSADIMKAWISTAVAYRGWNQTVRKQIENSR